jgi:hypothetical protein
MMRSESEFSRIPETPGPQTASTPQLTLSPKCIPVPDTGGETATTSHFATCWTFTRATDGGVQVTSSYGYKDTILAPDSIPAWPPTENYVVAANALLRALTGKDPACAPMERLFMEDTLLEILASAPDEVEIITWLQDALGYSRERVKAAMRYVLLLQVEKVLSLVALMKGSENNWCEWDNERRSAGRY